MNGLLGAPLLAALLAGIAGALFAGILIRPRARLSSRLRPYSVVPRSLLGRSADTGAVAPRVPDSTLGRIFGPPLVGAADRMGRLLEGASEETLARRLRQSGILANVAEVDRVQAYRMRQLGLGAAGAAVGATIGALAVGSTLAVLLTGIAGFVAGVALWRGRVDRAIADRRDRMRIELYTVNQLLAIRIRVGGGVVSAVRHLAERGDGDVIDELREALRQHQGGMSASGAFRRIAELTPEPHARRCYQVLATADERGSDLAVALLALSEDIRDDRREAIRRQATRRRAAMLIPIIALLAPILILFVAAPLPWIVLRGFG